MPSADAATTAGAAVFTGTAVTGPLSSLCFGTTVGGLPTIDPVKCPAIGILFGTPSNTGSVTVFTPTSTGTLPQSVTVAGLPFGGNTVAFAFVSGPCVGAGTQLTGTQVSAPTCAITAAGSLDGSCGLSSGSGTGLITYTPLLGAATVVPFAFAFVNVANTLVVTGTATGVFHSALVGVMEAIPVPTVTPPVVGNNCTTKTATSFTISGGIAFASI